MHPEYQYLKLIAEILKKGRTKKGRGIHPMKSIFGFQMKFDLRKGFPMMTTKKMPWKILVNELLWFISGDTNIKKLQENNIFYWDGFADEDGDLGPLYGFQWRKWPVFIPLDENGNEMWDMKYDHNGIIKPEQFPEEGKLVNAKIKYFDQLQWAIDQIKTNPDSKAIMVTAWNPGFNPRMRLPACHSYFQFDVRKGKLRLHLYQRAGDAFLGIPFNIAQYSLLLLMVAHITGLEAREFIHSIGDAHLYHNHLELAKEQLKREPKPLPTVSFLRNKTNIDDFELADLKLNGYKAHPRMKADLVLV